MLSLPIPTLRVYGATHGKFLITFLLLSVVFTIHAGTRGLTSDSSEGVYGSRTMAFTSDSPQLRGVLPSTATAETANAKSLDSIAPIPIATDLAIAQADAVIDACADLVGAAAGDAASVGVYGDAGSVDRKFLVMLGARVASDLAYEASSQTILKAAEKVATKVYEGAPADAIPSAVDVLASSAAGAAVVGLAIAAGITPQAIADASLFSVADILEMVIRGAIAQIS